MLYVIGAVALAILVLLLAVMILAIVLAAIYLLIKLCVWLLEEIRELLNF